MWNAKMNTNLNLNPLLLRLLGGSKNYNPFPFSNAKIGKSSWQGRDAYVKSADVTVTYEIYTAGNQKKRNYISQELMDYINNSSKMLKEGDVYNCNGVKFLASQIPPVRGELLHEIKAEENVMDFGSNQYFKYISSDGKEHYLYSRDTMISNVLTERLRGESYDKVANRYGEFWRRMASSHDTVFIGETFSDEEINQYMKEAGIEHGFFTVKMGSYENTRYYSSTKTTNVIQSKERYDIKYKSMISGTHFLSYEPGTVFKYGGKEYVLSESHTLDIPYGEDIYDNDPAYPKNYRYGVKIS